MKMRKILLLLMVIGAFAPMAASAQSGIHPTTPHRLPPDEKAAVIRFE
jgi:hypothetical protein